MVNKIRQTDTFARTSNARNFKKRTTWFTRGLASCAMIVAMAFGGCGAPLNESIFARPMHPRPIAQTHLNSEGQRTIDISEQYSPHTDPFELNDRLRTIADSLTGTNEEMAQQLFERLRVGGPEGVAIDYRSDRKPRTAAQTLVRGGDCSDLANIVIAVLRARNIPGGAIIFYPEDIADESHMVAYVDSGHIVHPFIPGLSVCDVRDLNCLRHTFGNQVISHMQIMPHNNQEHDENLFFEIDPQRHQLSRTVLSDYTIIHSLDYDEAASIYHSEWGLYFLNHRDFENANLAYQRSIELFDGDPVIHIVLADLYRPEFWIWQSWEDPLSLEQAELRTSIYYESAIRHLDRARELDPSFVADGTTGQAVLSALESDRTNILLRLMRETRIVFDADALTECCASIYRSILSDRINNLFSPEILAALNRDIDLCHAQLDQYRIARDLAARAYVESRYDNSMSILLRYLGSLRTIRDTRERICRDADEAPSLGE